MAETYEYDATNTLESKGQVLEFYQTFSGATVSFKAFLTQYAENFNCQWNAQSVFGRPDPIQTYQGTSRSFSIGWKIPAFSESDAQGNLMKTSTLTRMLYPEYSQVDNASTISKGPLIKIKFANLIYDGSRGPGGDVRTSGLLGVIKTLTWTPVLKDGFFDPENYDDANREAHDRSVSRINDGRTAAAQNSAPVWGADAALFPWSAGIQRANTIIGETTADDVAKAREAEMLEGGSK